MDASRCLLFQLSLGGLHPGGCGAVHATSDEPSGGSRANRAAAAQLPHTYILGNRSRSWIRINATCRAATAVSSALFGQRSDGCRTCHPSGWHSAAVPTAARRAEVRTGEEALRARSSSTLVHLIDPRNISPAATSPAASPIEPVSGRRGTTCNLSAKGSFSCRRRWPHRTSLLRLWSGNRAAELCAKTVTSASNGLPASVEPAGSVCRPPKTRLDSRYGRWIVNDRHGTLGRRFHCLIMHRSAA
jgi:hypothetical protein